jgi:hypothetical protein
LKKSKNNLQKVFIQALGGWGGKRGMGLFWKKFPKMQNFNTYILFRNYTVPSP